MCVKRARGRARGVNEQKTGGFSRKNGKLFDKEIFSFFIKKCFGGKKGDILHKYKFYAVNIGFLYILTIILYRYDLFLIFFNICGSILLTI